MLEKNWSRFHKPINLGPLVNVSIPIDHVSNRKRDFCFVEFQHKESVTYAIDVFKDIKLFGQTLHVRKSY